MIIQRVRKVISGRRPKYRNKRVEVDGIKFDSKRESYRFVVLRQMESEGLIFDLKVHPQYKFPMGFSYFADFEYREPIEKSGSSFVKVAEDVKTKATMTAMSRVKMKCLAYFYPAIDLRIV